MCLQMSSDLCPQVEHTPKYITQTACSLPEEREQQRERVQEKANMQRDSETPNPIKKNIFDTPCWNGDGISLSCLIGCECEKTEEMPDALADFEASAYKCTQVRRNPKMEGKE